MTKEFLDIQTNIECGFTLKWVYDMIRPYSQMHGTDKYSQHCSIIWLVWANVWVFVFELSGCRFKSSSNYMLLSSLLVSDQNNESSLYKANIGLLLLQSVTKMLVKIAIWAISCFYLLPSLENFGKEQAKPLEICYWFATLYRGRGGLLIIVFKIPIIFWHLLSGI